MPEKKSAIVKERIDPKTGKKIVTIRKKKKPEAKAPAKSSKAAFVKIEIAKGNLKKENGKIVKAKAPVEKKKIVEAKAPVQGPRNLVKGFGIKRKPKAKPAPKAKKPKEPKDGKILVSKMTYNKVVPDEFVYRSEENFQYSSDYLNWDWITGITSKMEDFYKENSRKFADGELGEAASRKMEKIEEKMMNNIRPSVERELKRSFKEWKMKNADKKLTLEEARDSFERFYF